MSSDPQRCGPLSYALSGNTGTHHHTASGVNDEETKRMYESASDAFRTVRRMLIGHPPDNWSQLLTQAKAHNKRTRAANSAGSR